MLDYNTAFLPELNNTFKLHKYYRAPTEPPEGLPPKLYPNLTLDSITKKWKSNKIENTYNNNTYKNGCIYA